MGKISIFVGILLFSGLSLCFAEDSVTITTYYPSPYGSYNELTTTSNTYLATDEGNVGIGTVNPSQKLEVQGNIRASRGFMIGTNRTNGFRIEMVDVTIGPLDSAGNGYRSTDLGSYFTNFTNILGVWTTARGWSGGTDAIPEGGNTWRIEVRNGPDGGSIVVGLLCLLD